MANRLTWYAVHALDEQVLTAGLGGPARGLYQVLKLAIWPHDQGGSLAMPASWWEAQTGYDEEKLVPLLEELADFALAETSIEGSKRRITLGRFGARAVADREAARKSFARHGPGSDPAPTDPGRIRTDPDKSGHQRTIADRSGPTVRDETVRNEEKTGATPPVPLKRDDAAVSEVFAHYRTYHERARPGAKERRLILARLKEGYSVEDLKLAVDGCHRSPHHLGENDRGTKYLDLELIVRDSSKVARFLEIARERTVGAEEDPTTYRIRRFAQGGFGHQLKPEEREVAIAHGWMPKPPSTNGEHA